MLFMLPARFFFPPGIQRWPDLVLFPPNPRDFATADLRPDANFPDGALTLPMFIDPFMRFDIMYAWRLRHAPCIVIAAYSSSCAGVSPALPGRMILQNLR